MKTIIVVLLLVLLAFGVCTTAANPIVERYFTELKFAIDGWKLEMHPSRTLLLDGWYLQSRSGRSYFRSGIRIDTGYVIITTADLLTPLVISRFGDSLSIGNDQSVRARLIFGNAGVGVIAAPRTGQSLCLTPNISDYYWYLDNSPTLGGPNDFINAMGTLVGTVREASGAPVRNVQVYYRSWPEQWVYSDSGGRFTISDCAQVDRLFFNHPNYQSFSQYVQIWPESTITRDYSLWRTVVYPLHIGDRWNWGFERMIIGDTLMPNGKRYAILQNPNYTQFQYQRYEANKVYAYEYKGNIDQLVYDFSVSPGQTIATIARPTDTTDIILVWKRDAEIFGGARSQWEFLFDVRHWIDEELYQVITDSIGVSHEEGAWHNADLLGAIINGVKYGTITDVHDPGQPLPIEFKLHQNYPNPFNPSTEIRYQTSVVSHVTLKAFDLLGRDVATLVDGVEEAGYKSVQFDASKLASGVYFYRLEAGNFIQTKKLIFIR